MEVHSKAKYPACALSNFAQHRFTIDGIECYSMEGFLQSLKYKSSDIQKEVCKSFGMKAKKLGASKDSWKKTQLVFWQGTYIKRDSDKFNALITKAFDCMFEQSVSFRSALEASHTTSFTHAIGKTKKSDTILTKREFCGQLTRLAKKL